MESKKKSQANPGDEKPTKTILLRRAKRAGSSPGIYLMKDEKGGVLYVGKAKNLRNRLSTYFKPAAPPSTRIQMLISFIHSFEVILTETESEALILENTLIKKYKPKFNIRLKDDKTYPYIKVNLGADFPRLEWTRKVRASEGRFFGPFPSAWEAKQVLRLLNETFQLRDCSENIFRYRSRPCLLFQIEKCSAPCVGKISKSEYSNVVSEVISVLEGKRDRWIQELTQGMNEASGREEFERAAFYRDQIQNLELVQQTQGVVEPGSNRNRDIVAFARKGILAHGTFLLIRGGKLIGVRHYQLQNLDQEVSDSEILINLISQHYFNFQENEKWHVPEELLLDLLPEDYEGVEKTISIAFKKSENKEDDRLIQVAKANAQHALKNSEKRQQGHGIKAVEEVANKLHLQNIPYRMECYDISDFQGEDAVASRVVFIEGAPDKNLYRRYKIKSVEGSNDFAMMKEVLGRRFLNKQEVLPELVIVDGGKGQLSQAVAIMEELNVQGVEVCGLAKAKTKNDFQSKEVVSSLERIFIPNRKNPVSLLPHSLAYQLLVHIRDEAHRFALNYHRHLRKKRIIKPD